MSTAPITLCAALDSDSRAKRLASFLVFSKGSVVLKDEFIRRPFKPGFCTFCGGQLPTTWRAVKINPDGSATWVESDHSEESLANVAKFRALPIDEYGLRKGYLLSSVTLCEVMTAESVWTKAKEILRAEYKRREEQDNAKAAGESERAKRAAKAYASNQTF